MLILLSDLKQITQSLLWPSKRAPKQQWKNLIEKKDYAKSIKQFYRSFHYNVAGNNWDTCMARKIQKVYDKIDAVNAIELNYKVMLMLF